MVARIYNKLNTPEHRVCTPFYIVPEQLHEVVHRNENKRRGLRA
jgi:hypothetical protein